MNVFAVDLFQKMLKDLQPFSSEKQAKHASLLENLKRILGSTKTGEDFIGNDGIPDFHACTFKDNFSQNRFCVAVRAAILLHEPRLTSLHVEILSNDSPSEITLVIQALSDQGPAQESYAFYFSPLDKTVQPIQKS